MDEDTDIWLEALAGRTAADDRRAAALEAQALRAQLLHLPHPATGNEPARDAGREHALLERARREGLLAARGQRGEHSRFARPATWATAGALAAFAAAAIALAIFLHPARRPDVERGGSHDTVLLSAPDPRRLKSELLGELRAEGIEASGYERLGLEGIDADLPQPIPERVREILAQHHIAPPPDGVLRIEIAPAEPR